MKRRKPLNQREAAAIAQAHLGPRGGVRIVWDPMWGPRKEILELKVIGDFRIHASHPTSWRKAFERAGVFEA